MAEPNDVIEVIPPVEDNSNLVDIPRPDAPAQATVPAVDKPLVEPPQPRNPDLELLEALRKERDKERAERLAERQKITGEAEQRIQAERRRAHEAERELQTRTGQAVRAHWQAVNSELNHATNSLAAIKHEIESAKRDLAIASSAGEHAKVAEMHERIALAAADLRAFEAEKHRAEQRVDEAKRAIEAMAAAAQRQEGGQVERRPPPEKKEATQPPRQPATPDEWIANCPPATQDWLKANKNFVTDPKLNRKLLRFADEWVDDNGTESLNTSAFVDAVKRRFGKEPEQQPVTEEAHADTESEIVEVDPATAKPAVRKATVAASAPVSRPAPPSSRPSSPTRVRLTPDQMAIASQIYPEAKTPQEARSLYAADLLRAHSDGKFASRE